MLFKLLNVRYHDGFAGGEYQYGDHTLWTDEATGLAYVYVQPLA